MGGRKKENVFFRTLKFMDAFKEPIKLSFDRGVRNEFSTSLGGVCSIMMYVIVLAYALQQAVIMFKLQQFEVKETTDYGVYNNTYKFGAEQNLTFAFGMSSGLTEDIGEMKAYYHSFPPSGRKITEIKTRNCTLDDFGLGEGSGNGWFLPVKESDVSVIKQRLPMLRCFDEPVTL